MINISKNSNFNLKPIELSAVREEVNNLLIDGEEAVAAFKAVRDQLIFTNRRIISVDVQGITGKRKEYSSLPYSKVQFYSIQTPGFAEIVQDSELELVFANGFKASFEIKGNCDILKIGKMISHFILNS